MNWSIESLKELGGELIKGGLPLLGTAVAGPAGGAIAALVLSAIGADSPGEAIREMQQNPSVVTDLEEIEIRDRVELQKLVIEQQRLEVQDRSNAREREVSIQEAGRTSWEMMVLGVLTILGLITLVVLIAVVEMQPGGREVLMLIAGALVSGYTALMSYYYGSSRGSAEKNALLANKLPAIELRSLRR